MIFKEIKEKYIFHIIKYECITYLKIYNKIIDVHHYYKPLQTTPDSSW